jgi:hypothetical protein
MRSEDWLCVLDPTVSFAERSCAACEAHSILEFPRVSKFESQAASLDYKCDPTRGIDEAAPELLRKRWKEIAILQRKTSHLQRIEGAVLNAGISHPSPFSLPRLRKNRPIELQ